MIQFASSRSPAAGIPFHVTGGSKVNAGQVKSLGPLEKCTPQSIVAATLSHGRPVCGRYPAGTKEVDDGEVLAPNPTDNEEIDRVTRSDLVFVPCVTRTTKRSTNGMPTIDGFHGLNGIPADYGVKFGCVATFTGMGDGMDQTKDNVGAGNIAGTQTIVNTGDRTIFAMQLVWASEFPYMVLDEDGNWIPGIEEIGHHKKQFRPATYGMNYANVTTIMKMVETEMQALVRVNPEVEDVDSFKLDIEKQLRFMLIRVDKSKMPMFYYAFLYAAHLLTQLIITKGSVTMVQFIEKALNEFWEMKRRDRCRYDIPLDEGLANMEIDQTSANLLQKLDISDLPDGNSKLTSNFLSWYRCVLAALVEAMKEVQALQHDFMNARVIGLALNTAEPGKPLDVLLRAYHN